MRAGRKTYPLDVRRRSCDRLCRGVKCDALRVVCCAERHTVRHFGRAVVLRVVHGYRTALDVVAAAVTEVIPTRSKSKNEYRKKSEAAQESHGMFASTFRRFGLLRRS